MLLFIKINKWFVFDGLKVVETSGDRNMNIAIWSVILMSYRGWEWHLW